MTYEEILKVLKDTIHFSDLYYHYNQELKVVGKINNIRDAGSFIGSGEDYYKIIHFVDHDVYMEISAELNSYEGNADLEEGWSLVSEVKPVKRTITFYE